MAPALKHDWPQDGAMVALFALHGSRVKVAQAIGVDPSVLAAYLRRDKRAALRATCDAVQPKRSASAYRTYANGYPSDDEVVALMASHGSYAAVAAALEVSRGSLRDYLRIRPALAARVRAHQRPKLTPQQARENARTCGREYMRRKQLEDPEAVRASKRKSERKRREGKVSSVGASEYADVLALDPCSYCGGRCEEIDHIDALSRGGTGDFENLTASCRVCNRRKYTHPILHFMLGRAVA